MTLHTYIHSGVKTKVLCFVNNVILGQNRINPMPTKPIWEKRKRVSRRKDYTLEWGLADCRKCIFDYRGKDNTIEIGAGSILRNVEISIVGCGNKVKIGENCGIHNLSIVLEGNNDKVLIGDNCNFFCGDLRGIIMGGHDSDVIIEDDCLFAPGIIIRSHDAHSIFNREDGTVLNSGSTVRFGRHVWMASRATVHKGTTIGKETVIGADSFLSNRTIPGNVLVAGNPCRVVRENIDWKI